jgi:hypothetical protein
MNEITADRKRLLEELTDIAALPVIIHEAARHE